MAVEDFIPVVDFSEVLAAKGPELANLPAVLELHSAFSQVGFVFLKNHGIKRELVMMNL